MNLMVVVASNELLEALKRISERGDTILSVQYIKDMVEIRYRTICKGPTCE